MSESGDPPPSSILSCDFSASGDVGDAPFAFETDHEALRSNADYAALLRAMAALQAQKMQAVRDREKLIEARDEALADPIAFVKRLQAGEHLELPGKQKVAELPDIEWEKYRVVAADEAVRLRPDTRHAPTPSSSSNSSSTRVVDGQYFVRGRAFDEKKPVTFNQPWTPEEQRRLEELLVQFPSEDVEMERWKKIATALGNRTPIQVQSRTQKYFLKLQKAGMPVPGRVGKTSKRYVRHNTSGRATNHASKKYGLIGQKNSTFFPSLAPDVKMEDDDADNDYDADFYSNNDTVTTDRPAVLNDAYYLEDEDVSDEEDVPVENRDTDDYRELMWLKRIRREKELEQNWGGVTVHAGFRCDGCDVEPIVGSRFQCSECLHPDTVDFCCDCAPKGLAVGSNHKKTHILKPVRRKKTTADNIGADKEYGAAARSYLDPNFMK